MTQRSKTDDMAASDLEVSNFDRSIPDGLEDELREHAGERFAFHTARDFCGYVYFDGARFVEEVFRRGAMLAELYGTSLEEVIELANEEYGDD